MVKRFHMFVYKLCLIIAQYIDNEAIFNLASQYEQLSEQINQILLINVSNACLVPSTKSSDIH